MKDGRIFNRHERTFGHLADEAVGSGGGTRSISPSAIRVVHDNTQFITFTIVRLTTGPLHVRHRSTIQPAVW